MNAKVPPSSPELQPLNEPQEPPDTVPVLALMDERRTGARYLCQIKTLYHAGDERTDMFDKTWNVARIIDISTRGVALLLKFPVSSGTVLSLVPMISSWNPDWVLSARVMNVRPAAERRFCLGCEFVEPLSSGQLQVFLQNSK
jgi:hypothetical protein